MTKRTIVILAAALTAALALEAAPAKAPAKPTGKAAASAPSFDPGKFRIEHKKFVLDNGLTLIVHEDHSVPIVAVNTWYHVGSRNEKRGKTGFAHLFEHFFFNGSENYPHGFREAMDDLGANNRNGTTNGDRTNFFEDVPVSALERTLYLEADRMGFLAGNLSKELLERERGVVQNEKRQGENQPYGRVWQRMVETVFPYSHPYSWSTIGSMEDLNAATLDDIKEWYATYYGPNNCVLALAGDITADRALELVKKYFGGIPPGPPLTRAETWVPRLDRNIREEMQDRVPQVRIYRGWNAPAWKDDQILHLGLVAEVLSGSKSALMDRRLVYDKELVTDINVAINDGELASSFLIVATVKPGVDPTVVEKEIDAILKDFIRTGPPAADLQRAQSRALANFVRGTERLGGFGGRSDVLAENATYSGNPETYLSRLKTTATASASDVHAAAKQWLDAPHYTMVVKPFPPLKPVQSALDRKLLPALAEAPDVTFPPVQRATLSNGLKVMLMERHSTPLVALSLAVDAGHVTDSAAQAGLAGLAMDVMDEGTKSRDAFGISDDLDALGATLSTGNALDLSFVDLEALSTNLRGSLEIFADVALNPSFADDTVALAKQRRIARIAQEQAQPNTSALRILPRLLYGPDHAYGKPFTGTGFAATVAPLTRADLTAWHQAWFHPNHTTLIVAGDVTMKELVPELERAFGSWKRGQAPAKNLEAVPRTAGRKVYLLDKPGATQSVIVATHVSEKGGLPEDLAIETVMRNFGGMATSRLNRNLRLDKHWSYGTAGTVNDARGQRPFFVIAPVQTDKTKEAILEVVKEIRGVAGERPIEGEEYTSLMRSSILRLPGAFETLDSLVAAATRMEMLGRSEEYYMNYARNVRGLTAEHLNSAAKRVVHPDEMIWIIVGDLAKVEAGIRELNLGEVVKLEGAM